MAERRLRTVTLLGVSQTLAWASSYYLPAVLAVPMARDLGLANSTVFAAFSLALVVCALVGPSAGRAIDHWGGRPVLGAANGVFAVGLTVLATAQGPASLVAAWVVMGLAMGMGLYESAFATLVRLYGWESRGAITGVTLFAGFASTVGWPLSTLGEVHLGWRGTCWAWAAVQLLLALPLNLALPNARRPAALPEPMPDLAAPTVSERPSPAPGTAALVAGVFAASLFINSAMASHLPRLLQLSGASLTAAVTASSLVGPAQVAARVLEYSLLRRMHPLFSARLATLTHPLGAVVLLAFGAPSAGIFAVLHGAGNGVLTIAKGVLPLVLFGAQGYGARQGLLSVPSRIAQALAPWLFGLCLDRWGARAVVVTAAASMGAFAALSVLARRTPPSEAVPLPPADSIVTEV